MMKKFIKKSILLFIPLVLIIYTKPLYLLIDDQYQSIVAGAEIYTAIKKSKRQTKHKKILIGDSVANQLFPSSKKQDSLYSLTSNQAISLAGQYFLLQNYINSGNNPAEVYLIYSPFSFSNNLDQVFTYHYFLKPFYTEEYSPFFTATVTAQIDKIPFASICHEPCIQTTNWAPNFESKDSVIHTFLSPISKEYLSRMKALCDTNGVDFYIIPVPTRASAKGQVDSLNKLECQGLNLDKEFAVYFNELSYESAAVFRDPIHLREPKKFVAATLAKMNEVKRLRQAMN